jgi:hypothetical protein
MDGMTYDMSLISDKLLLITFKFTLIIFITGKYGPDFTSNGIQGKN